MSSIHNFAPGDFLIFQLEAGYALLRVLDVESVDGDDVWHVAAYSDLFLDAEMADAAIDRAGDLKVELSHVALTNRAFESTQVAKMRNISLTENELAAYDAWKTSDREISDRSIRLLLGWR
ncbi:MAG TPA: hypothetical protein VJV05_01165 [Pyrinomonadaceae bacterium]|nr:hypothetical protein [Pyrinomonadaceae bacterium]